MKTGIFLVSSIILLFTARHFNLPEISPFEAKQDEIMIHEEETELIKIHNFQYDEYNQRLKFSVYNKGDRDLSYQDGYTLELRDNQGKWNTVPLKKNRNTYSFTIKPDTEHDSIIPIPSPGTYRITKRYEEEKGVYDVILTFILANDNQAVKIKGEIKTIQETLN